MSYDLSDGLCFEFEGSTSQGPSHKYWIIKRFGKAVVVKFGKVGTRGQIRTKNLQTEEKAEAYFEKKVAEKIGKGYEQVVMNVEESTNTELKASGESNILSYLIWHADYSKLEEVVANQVKSDGWPRVAENILKSCRHPIRFGSIPQYTVKRHDMTADDEDFIWGRGHSRLMHDVLSNILGLASVQGMDSDIAYECVDIESQDLYDLRNEVQSIAIEKLKQQIAKKNTYFLSVEDMLESPFAILVDDVIQTRFEEIESLPFLPSPYDIAKTYYGFQILTSQAHDDIRGLVPDEMRGAVEALLLELGKNKEVQESRLQIQSLKFENCSEYLQSLLRRLVEISLGGTKHRNNALRELARIGDARVIPHLLTFLSKVTNKGMRDLVLQALGAIGHPTAFKTLNVYARNGNAQAMKALAGTRHPDTFDTLIAFIEQGGNLGRSALGALWRVGDQRVITYHREQIRLGIANSDCIRNIVLLGVEGLKILFEHPTQTVRLMTRSHFARLFSHSNLFEDEGIRHEVKKSLHAHKHPSRLARILVRDFRIRDANILDGFVIPTVFEVIDKIIGDFYEPAYFKDVEEIFWRLHLFENPAYLTEFLKAIQTLDDSAKSFLLLRLIRSEGAILNPEQIELIETSFMAVPARHWNKHEIVVSAIKYKPDIFRNSSFVKSIAQSISTMEKPRFYLDEMIRSSDVMQFFENNSALLKALFDNIRNAGQSEMEHVISHPILVNSSLSSAKVVEQFIKELPQHHARRIKREQKLHRKRSGGPRRI